MQAADRHDLLPGRKRSMTGVKTDSFVASSSRLVVLKSLVVSVYPLYFSSFSVDLNLIQHLRLINRFENALESLWVTLMFEH